MIKHRGINVNYETRYLCNQAVGITQNKIVWNDEEVTCKNCLRILKNHIEKVSKK